MPFWQRLLVLIAAVIVVSFVFNLTWHAVFGFYLPSYASGVVGGLAAVVIWDFLKKKKIKKP